MNSVSRRWSLTLASTLAAAILAACGGASGPSPAAVTAQAPTVLVQAPAAEPVAAAIDVASTPVETDGRTPAAGAANPAANNAYIVQLDEMPVTAYDGGIQGLGATKPKKGQKIDPNSPAVTNYMAHQIGRAHV